MTFKLKVLLGKSSLDAVVIDYSCNCFYVVGTVSF